MKKNPEESNSKNSIRLFPDCSEFPDDCTFSNIIDKKNNFIKKQLCLLFMKTKEQLEIDKNKQKTNKTLLKKIIGKSNNEKMFKINKNKSKNISDKKKQIFKRSLSDQMIFNLVLDSPKLKRHIFLGEKKIPNKNIFTKNISETNLIKNPAKTKGLLITHHTDNLIIRPTKKINNLYKKTNNNNNNSNFKYISKLKVLSPKINKRFITENRKDYSKMKNKYLSSNGSPINSYKNIFYKNQRKIKTYFHNKENKNNFLINKFRVLMSFESSKDEKEH